MDNPTLITGEEVFTKLLEAGPKPEKVTFVFGAGASYGYSRNSKAYVPPIVSELFSDENSTVNEIIKKPEHLYILDGRDFIEKTLQKTYGGDLEEYLSSLYEGDDDDDYFAALLIYLQDVCQLASVKMDKSNNNYKFLCEKFRALRGKRPWTCISFNYDTLFERSYIATGRNLERNFSHYSHYAEDYPKLLKMHGGINFRYIYKEVAVAQKRGRHIFNLMMKEKLVKGSSSVLQDARVAIPDFFTTSRMRDEEGIFREFAIYNFPLMMIPIHTTKKSENPFFEEMLLSAQQEIEASSLVVSIGYNFGDKLFCEAIKNINTSNKELLIVDIKKSIQSFETGNKAKQIKEFWKGPVRIFDGNGFTDFIDAII